MAVDVWSRVRCCNVRRVDAIETLENMLQGVSDDIRSMRETGFSRMQLKQRQEEVDNVRSTSSHVAALPAMLIQTRAVGLNDGAFTVQEEQDRSREGGGLTGDQTSTQSTTTVLSRDVDSCARAPLLSESSASPIDASEFNWAAAVNARASRRGVYAGTSSGFITFRTVKCCHSRSTSEYHEEYMFIYCSSCGPAS